MQVDIGAKAGDTVTPTQPPIPTANQIAGMINQALRGQVWREMVYPNMGRIAIKMTPGNTHVNATIMRTALHLHEVYGFDIGFENNYLFLIRGDD